MKLFSALVFAIFASVDASHSCAIQSQPPTPAETLPYLYVVGSSPTLDQYLCQDSHLATFSIGPGPGGALVKATLTASAWDIDPTEDNNILIDGAVAGPMDKGGNGCWSVTTLDVTSMIQLSSSVDIHIDIDTAGGWCARTDWISIELEYDNGVVGDPHFKTWGGKPYDFHGVCDLVLLSNPQFKNHLGLDIHIRTEKARLWSYVSSLAIRIGEETLEVMGGTGDAHYWINGQKGKEVTGATLPGAISGHIVSFKTVSSKSREFVVDLGDGATINIKTWNAYVGVSIKGANLEQFGASVGLMGGFPHGKKLARDNATIMDDSNTFGQEWQVLPSEAKLFHNVQGPQAPEKCEIPSTSQMRRRLGSSVISKEDAEVACARVSSEDFDLCVFDVLATNQKDAAGAY